jgi:hypothetical protein
MPKHRTDPRLSITISQRNQPMTVIEKPEPAREIPKARSPKWNPETQQLDYPPTSKQVKAIFALSIRCRVDCVSAKTRREAGERIEGLIKLRKAQQRKAKRGRKRKDRLNAESPEQKAKRAQKRIERLAHRSTTTKEAA